MVMVDHSTIVVGCPHFLRRVTSWICFRINCFLERLTSEGFHARPVNTIYVWEAQQAMRKPSYTMLVDKSVDACVAAIEVYNKPDFRYREEAFSILMFNAWELLLKSRILRENGGRARAIEVWEPKKKRDGANSKRMRPKRNRSGTVITIDAMRAAAVVRGFTKDNIDDACVDNLSLLAEIRDGCVHLATVGPGLGKRVQEVGAASLRNFVRAVEAWFKRDLGRFNFFLMPLAFHSPAEAVVSLLKEKRPAAKRLLEHIAAIEQKYAKAPAGSFNVTMQVELTFVRTAHPEAIPVRQTPDGIPVTLSEADVRSRWPWDFGTLTAKLRDRYADFCQNRHYTELRRTLEGDLRYCHTRHLDPGNPRAGSKRFYSPNIVAEFDKHYTLRRVPAALST